MPPLELAWTADYRARVRQRAAELRSDGCTGVPEFYQDACFEHDVHYRTGATLDGVPLTRADADRIFRHRIQAMSPFGVFSPMSWWRWAAVRLFGASAWHAHADRAERRSE